MIYQSILKVPLCSVLIGLTLITNSASDANARSRSEPKIKAIDPAYAKVDNGEPAPAPNRTAGTTSSAPEPAPAPVNSQPQFVPQGAQPNFNQYGYPSAPPNPTPAYAPPYVAPRANPYPNGGYPQVPYQQPQYPAQYAPPVMPPQNVGPMPGSGNQQLETPQEKRVSRLEQRVFGSSYPEHDLDDRLEHLEREVFTAIHQEPVEQRISGLEARLGGPTAFGPASAPLPSLPKQKREPRPEPQPIDPPAAKATPPQDRAASEFLTAVESIPFDATAGDYASDIKKCVGGFYARWSTLPVRVHVPINTPTSWMNALQLGVQKWSQAIPTMIVPTSEPADIEIAWINHLAPKQVGISNREIFNGRMRVTIYLLRPTYYPPDVSEKALPRVVQHELGHALGLWGHSRNASDIMQGLDGPLTSKSPVITPRDFNTLKRIYQSPGLPDGFESSEPAAWPFTHYAPLRK